ncbi:MAG: leucine-rich repeat domain-containing protein, partial [Candidatus Odinarchaeota archaeon]
KYLSLKLENEKTIIYINEKEFIQCKCLLVEIRIKQLDDFKEVFSIYDLSEEELSYHNNKYRIAPEMEFWGHCSNLQVWYENNYDTRLLHRNLAFPLLKKLTEVGDPLAKRVFKEELTKRLITGNPNVARYFLEEDYFHFLEQEDMEFILENIDITLLIGDDSSFLFLLLNKVDNIEFMDLSRIKWLENLEFIRDLRVENRRLKNLKGVEYFSNLESLNLNENYLMTLKGLQSLKTLKELNINKNQLKEIKGLDNLISLKELYLWMNHIEEIKGLENLSHLEKLSLGGNEIKEIKGLEKLSNLKSLDLSYNQVREIKGLENLKKLEFLNLGGNQIREIKGLENLPRLKSLNLSYNQLLELKGLESNKNLQILYLQDNKLAKIDVLEKLTNLKELWLYNNNITIESIDHLRTLKIKVFN